MSLTRLRGADRMIWPLCLAALLAVPTDGAALQSPADLLSCSCESSLSDLVRIVESDYAAYVLDIRRNRTAAYETALSQAAAAAARVPPSECVGVLQRFVASFRDGHAFVATYPRLSSTDSTRLASAAARVRLDEGAVRAVLASVEEPTDPIEGIWYDLADMRAAVVRAPGGSPDEFLAVHLDGTPDWERGHIKAEFQKLPDGSYDVVYFGGAHEPLRPHVYARGYKGGAVLRRGGSLLHMPPFTWGRMVPAPSEQAGRLHFSNPRAPTARTIGDSIVVFSIPSHSPEHRSILEGLVESYRATLERAELLVVDLRGNEGGSSGTTNALLPYVLTKDSRQDRPQPQAQPGILSSPNNIEWIENQVSDGWIPPGLIARMRSHPAEVIAFDDPLRQTDEPTVGSTSPEAEFFPRPRRVALLVDDGVVSAAEALVLRALSSTRVTLFGAPTGGTIDYQTVRIRRFGCPDLDLGVGLPVIVGSLSLPDDGINPTGILPDVVLPLDDPIKEVLEWYSRR